MKYKLQEIIDIEHFQNLQDRLNEIYSFPSSIIDNDGNILTATAWQDICTKFHRKHKECEKHCIQSDKYILSHLHEANPAVSYRCPHGLVDNAMPIIIDGVHYGNFFTGQFFLETPDLDFFRTQAQKYGFDEKAYIEAVKKVPIWSQEQLNSYLNFIKGLIEVISESALKNLKEVENRRLIEDREKHRESILQSAMDGYWLTDTEGRLIEVNDTYCRMSGYSEAELLAMRVSDLEAVENPRHVAEHMQKVISKGSDRFESRHRRKDGAVFDVEISIQYRPEEGGQCVVFSRDISERKEAEKALRESEQKFRNIFDSSSDAIFIHDMEHHFIEVNEVACQRLGYSREELLRMGPIDIDSPESAELFREKIHSIRSDVTQVIEAVHIGKDGTQIPVEINSRKIEYNGKPCVLSVARNVTERKKAEAKLREALNFNQLIIDTSPVGLLVFSSAGPCVMANPAAEKIVNTSRKNLLSLNYKEMDSYKKNGILADMEKALETGAVIQHEVHTINTFGHDVWFEGSVSTFEGEGEKNILYLFRDIRDRKELEKQLLKQHAEFQAIFNSITDAIIFTDIDRQIVRINPAFKSMFGYDLDEVRGKTTEIVYANPDEYYKQGEIRFSKNAKSPTPVFEIEYRRKDGTVFPSETLGVPVTDSSGDTIGFLGVIRDLTERKKSEREMASLKKAQEQSQKMESIGALSGGIAHDFNNLLFPITGLSEMLLEDLPEGSIEHENAKEIFKAARRASDLVNQILSFSRQGDQQKTPVRIQDILKDVLKLTRATIPSNIQIQSKIQSDCGLVMADPTQIHQVAMNLFTNAYHAVENDGGTITVSLEEATPKNSDIASERLQSRKHAVLTVSDNGCGIDPLAMVKIFEPYFTTKPQGKGTGLGLSVVYGIVKDHDGDIQVKSEPGKGSSVTVYLPLITRSREASVASIPGPLETGDERILLVDDEESVVRLEAQVLQKLGYEVTALTSSVDALTLFRSNPDRFDLVITDMTMPNMTGDRLAREMLSIKPGIQIIVCTGFSEKLSKEKAESIGIKGFLMKPVLKSDMAKTVRKVLDNGKGPNH